ncbi:MAG: AsnC family transcriptional regulator [Rhodospirillales bacterium]|jgi:DNA-binding Lrp family transcriptional regulator|nr:AsnC family transcriptional regulator [Rhodospirillales bacterium]
MTAESTRSAPSDVDLDGPDRALVNLLQGGFPLSERPFAEVGWEVGLGEDEVIARLARLLDAGVLSRFGPMYNAEKLGGGLTLAAMRVPADDFERVARQVNAFPEVAHNYARDDDFNMWFVLATEEPGRVARAIAEIEEATGIEVFDMPKIEEFFVGLRFEA